jgi:hypothetical protein
MSVSIVEGSVQIQGTVSGTDITPVSLHNPSHAIRIYLENPPTPNIIIGDVFANPLVGTDGITIISGMSTTTVAGFRSELLTTSGFLQNQIANLDNIYATDVNLTSVSGHLQNQISSINVDEIEPAIVGGANIVVVSGANTITISSTASGDGKAIVGSDGITVVTGTSTISVAGFRTEFVSASGYLQNQISSINTDEIEPAIVGGQYVAVTSGSSTIRIDASPPSASAIVAGSNIVVVSGTNTITVSSTASGGGTSHAILGSDFINVASGTNSITVSADAIVGSADHITVTSGTNTVTIDLPTTISNLTRIQAVTVSGTNIDAAGTVSASNGTFANTLTISGVPVLHKSFLTVEEFDGFPSVSNVTSIVLGSGTVVSDLGGGRVRITENPGNTAYTFTQASPATSWSITHGLGTRTPSVTVYSPEYEVFFPASISGVNTNETLITFSTPVAGTAFFTAMGGGSPSSVPTKVTVAGVSFVDIPIDTAAYQVQINVDFIPVTGDVMFFGRGILDGGVGLVTSTYDQNSYTNLGSFLFTNVGSQAQWFLANDHAIGNAGVANSSVSAPGINGFFRVERKSGSPTISWVLHYRTQAGNPRSAYGHGTIFGATQNITHLRLYFEGDSLFSGSYSTTTLM